MRIKNRMQPTRQSLFIIAVCYLAAFASTAVADDALIGHWQLDAAHIDGQTAKDLTGRADATITGKAGVKKFGEIDAVEFDGRQPSIEVATDYKKTTFPKREITAEAWVSVSKPENWGGLVGILQDNGNYEKGWLLGYISNKFTFGVQGTGGKGELTYLRSKTSFRRGKWYHVVGTYDGANHRVYVNGKLEASSTDQSGDIEYPPAAFYQIGAYRDQDEFFRLSGALHEVRVYSRALTTDEVKSRYAEKASKVPQPSPLRLPAVFGTNMVLQRGREIPVWGWAAPNDEITVSLASFRATTKADDKGKWRLRLPAQKAGGPHKMIVAGKKHRVEFKDVLIGEVWVCSGQSNMQWGVNASRDAAKEIAAAKLSEDSAVHRSKRVGKRADRRLRRWLGCVQPHTRCRAFPPSAITSGDICTKNWMYRLG